MRLLVDCGNSRIKWAQSDGGWHTGAAAHRGADLIALLDEYWGPLNRPRQVVVSCVVEAARAVIARWVEARWKLAAKFMEAQAQTLDVRNLYLEPNRLGADRWAALIAVRGLTKAPACVVDCGTAVTVDALSADGDFVGGVIFPGLELLRSSLARGTAAIGPEAGDSASCQARATADAVAAGTLFGLAGAVERLVAEQRAVLGASMEVFITGGDAPAILSHLRVPLTHVPDLVLRGLDRMAPLL